MRNPFPDGKSRSLAGLALAAVIIPFLLALTGCLKVPIGDPEKSQIDPTFSGVWLADEGDEDTNAVWLFEPYDARTWLITRLEPEKPVEPKGTIDAPSLVLDALTLLEREDAALSELNVFKAWLAPIGDMRFLVLESKMSTGGPEEWLTFGIVNKGNATLELRMINFELEGLKDAETAAEAEAIIARHIGNPKLFTADPIVLARVPAADYGRVEKVLEDLSNGN